MPPITILKYPTSSPSDLTPLNHLKAAGHDLNDILAIIGKTEGNGCVNDFSRTLATHAWLAVLPPSAITIFSGGTEGVLSPHVTFIIRTSEPTGLAANVGHTRDLEPWEIGTSDHESIVKDKVLSMMGAMNVEKQGNVEMVLIKCPLLTSEKLSACEQVGKQAVTKDTYESMARSRRSAAMGIEAALRGMQSAPHNRSPAEWSDRANCSSGAELENNHILVLATDPTVPAADAKLRAFHGYMADAMDHTPITDTFRKVSNAKGKVVQVFVKAEASPDGMVRGFRHTMNTDSDIHSTRHARAAVGGLVAGLVGDPCVYVSGGAEGQGPPGGGSLCVVWKE